MWVTLKVQPWAKQLALQLARPWASLMALP